MPGCLLYTSQGETSTLFIRKTLRADNEGRCDALLFGVAAFLATPGYPGKSTAGYIEAQSRRAFGVTQ